MIVNPQNEEDKAGAELAKLKCAALPVNSQFLLSPLLPLSPLFQLP